MGNEYMTINKTPGAEKKNWCLVLKAAKPVKQAGVKIGDKTYQYASNYEIDKNDVAVIGAKNQPKTQGEMGTVESTLDKLEIKKSYAADLAFVFTDKADKKMIAACKKYIADNNDKPDADGTNLFPITFTVRKLLAACCIVAYPQFASKDDIKEAKDFIHDVQGLDDCRSASQNSFELYDYYGTSSPAVSDEWLSPDDYYDMSKKEQKEIDDEFNRRVFCDTVAIMLRGGFVNLLEALLSVDPPIKEFYDELIDSVGEAYNATAMAVLKAYDPAKKWKACENAIRKIAGEREQLVAPIVTAKTASTQKPKKLSKAEAAAQQAQFDEEMRKRREDYKKEREEFLKHLDYVTDIDINGKIIVFDSSIETPPAYIPRYSPSNPIVKQVMDKGAIVRQDVSGKTNYFVVGIDGEYLHTVAKGWKKAVELQGKGNPIKIITVKNLLDELW